LLGRERLRRGRYAEKSHVWCDFGGGVSPHSPSLLGASREFAEETMGVVVGKSSNTATIEFVSQRVCPQQPIRSMFGTSVPYDMYLVQIPFDVNIPQTFLERRQLAQDHTAHVTLHGLFPDRCFHRSGRMRDAFLEKDCLQWVTWHELLEYATTHHSKFPLRREFSATIFFFATRILRAVSERLSHAAISQPHGAPFTTETGAE
jgi:hypothetical protein